MAEKKTFCRTFTADGRADYVQVPKGIADLVRALSSKGIALAAVADDSIILADGRTLYVRFGFQCQKSEKV